MLQYAVVCDSCKQVITTTDDLVCFQSLESGLRVPGCAEDAPVHLCRGCEQDDPREAALVQESVKLSRAHAEALQEEAARAVRRQQAEAAVAAAEELSNALDNPVPKGGK